MDRLLTIFLVILVAAVIGGLSFFGIHMMSDTNKNQENEIGLESEIKSESEKKIEVKDSNIRENTNDEQEVQNPLSSLDSLDNIKTDTLHVTKDRITAYYEEDGVNAMFYYQFDENNNIQSIVYEFFIDNEELRNEYINAYKGTTFEENIKINENGAIVMDYPVSDYMKSTTKQEIAEMLSKKYKLEYE